MTPVAIVTGGSGGLGAAICQGLASSGFRVAVGWNTASAAGERVASELAGDGHLTARVPVTDSAEAARSVEAIVRQMLGCDVLVNCAGTTQFVPHDDLDGLDDSLIDSIFATNVRGAFAMVRACRPHLEHSSRPGGGVVVNISSIAARTAMGSNVAYCASKAALDSMTMSLARALAPNIRVVSVSPGLVDTDFVSSLDTAWRAHQERSTPLGRLTRPDEVARAVVAVVRDLTFTTGAIIPVDGGRPLS